MDALKNALPIILIDLILALPFPTLFYYWIKIKLHYRILIFIAYFEVFWSVFEYLEKRYKKRINYYY